MRCARSSRFARFARGAAAFAFAAAALVLPWAPADAIEIQKVVSPGGIEAWLVEDHANPVIAVDFAFRGGAALDPAGKEGLANLVSATLDEGAGDLDSQAFQGRLEDLSISLGFDAGMDDFQGTLGTLTENRDEAFRLLALALTKPRFDPEAVERIRAQILAGIRRDESNPRRVGGRRLYEILFPDHPYGRPSKGTADSVKVIKIADLKLFVLERLARDNLVISVVGDVTPAELGALLDKTFGGLPEHASSWTVPETRPTDGPRTVVIEKPIPQSLIYVAQAGIKRDDPGFYAAYVMNYILGGGGFSSRLYEEIREKRGLAYSAYSYLTPFDHAGLIMGGAGTENARAAETLALFREEWRRMREKGVTAKEIEDAKTYLTGSYALRFSSSGHIASVLTGIQLEKLGIDYIDRRNALIEAVTIDDANRAAKRLIDPETLVAVVVGQPAGLASQP